MRNECADGRVLTGDPRPVGGVARFDSERGCYRPNRVGLREREKRMTSNRFVVHPGTGTVLRADECETVTVPHDILALLTGDDYFDEAAICEYATYYRAANPTDARVCLCGNRPDTDGFYPCLPNGEHIEPTVGSAWDGNYRCARCGLVFRQGDA